MIQLQPQKTPNRPLIVGRYQSSQYLGNILASSSFDIRAIDHLDHRLVVQASDARTRNDDSPASPEAGRCHTRAQPQQQQQPSPMRTNSATDWVVVNIDFSLVGASQRRLRALH
jgi:hypothetical protein